MEKKQDNKELLAGMNKVKVEKTYTTKDLAMAVGMTGKQVRAILRKTERYNDGQYTRYSWNEKAFQGYVKAIKEYQASKMVKATQE